MTQKALLKRWKSNQRYTLKFVNLIPEEMLSFKPFPGGKTYQSQLSHITTWLRTHSRFVTGTEFEKAGTKNKEEITAALTEFFTVIISYLEDTTESELAEIVKVWYGEVPREVVLSVMDNHLSHHRGQMVVYLRLLDIKPPAYHGGW